MVNLQENKNVVENLLIKALPSNDIDYVRSIVTPTTVLSVPDSQLYTMQQDFLFPKMVTLWIG